MKLVEVIPGIHTENSTVQTVMGILRIIGKEPVRVKDVAGFAVNRTFDAILIETCRLLKEEVASAEDIDKACKLGLGHPMGLFELMDILNNMLNLEVQEILFNAYGERRTLQAPPKSKTESYRETFRACHSTREV